jgi:hypothetical protein
VGLFSKLFGIGAAPKPAAPKQAETMAILPTSAMTKDAQEDQAEVMKLLQARIVASEIFVPEKIPLLVSKLRGANGPFQRINTDAAFHGQTLLSVDEKKKLGLNTRMKYSHDFIACCDLAKIATTEPKGALVNMHHAAFFTVARKRELSRFQASGVVKSVRIAPLGDPDACAAVQRLNRAYALDNAPELPLSKCDAKVCRCQYQLGSLR